MKKSSIVLIIFLAFSIGILISTVSSGETYADFYQAFSQPYKEYTVVGQLNKRKNIIYNPSVNPNLVSFYMIDKKGNESMVVLNQSKPQDMEKSEDIVIKGRGQDTVFYAHTILLKCPSKYAEENKFSSSNKF
jgi:cytochrome c-type biogenesis protein CcmE